MEVHNFVGDAVLGFPDFVRSEQYPVALWQFEVLCAVPENVPLLIRGLGSGSFF